MKKSLILLIGILSIVTPVKSDLLKYENYIYEDQIKTVLLSTNGAIYNPVAVIEINSGDQLRLTFDELKPEADFYQYTFVHCNANWEPSNLLQQEYMVGPMMADIKNFKFSTNTYQQYVHYTLVFPNTEVELTKSGNYLLKVFRNFNEEELIITRRFMVLDNQTKINGSVKPATNPKDRFYKQEVDFEVNYENFQIPNPFMDVTAIVIQNNSWNNIIPDLKPQFISNNTLNYNYENENLFDGSNEFRFFDIRTLRFFSNNVERKFIDSVTNVVLKKDELRGHLSYFRYLDYNGKRVVQNADGNNVAEDGDYALVHFYLESSNEIKTGPVYLYGEMTDWRIDEKYRMTFLPDRGYYYGAFLLKQSYYNYHYVVPDKITGKPLYDFTEGNHQETENEYYVYIYHKNQMYGYDELIGMKRISTSDVTD